MHVVSLDGRDAHRITDDPADDLAPLWSPDSRYLAFTSNRGGTVSLWTVEVQGRQAGRSPMKLKDGMQSARLIDWAGRGIFYDQQTTHLGPLHSDDGLRRARNEPAASDSLFAHRTKRQSRLVAGWGKPGVRVECACGAKPAVRRGDAVRRGPGP